MSNTLATSAALTSIIEDAELALDAIKFDGNFNDVAFYVKRILKVAKDANG